MQSGILLSNLTFHLKFLRLLFLTVFMFFNFTVYGENNGDQDNSKSQKVQLEKAEAAYKKNLEKKLLADSLMNLGISIHNESSEQIWNTINQMSITAREYSARIKELEKHLISNSTAEANSIRAEIKMLEDDYKKALNNFDLVMKDQIKKSDDGTRNLNKGFSYKKEVSKSLRHSHKNLKQAQLALNEHNAGPGKK